MISELRATFLPLFLGEPSNYNLKKGNLASLSAVQTKKIAARGQRNGLNVTLTQRFGKTVKNAIMKNKGLREIMV